MFELLVPASPMQLGQVEGDTNAYDLQLRPHLMMQAIQALQDAGVEPDIWKIEGLDRREECVKLVETARMETANNDQELVSAAVRGVSIIGTEKYDKL
jgi:myo-inositol catabolism protein IolC